MILTVGISILAIYVAFLLQDIINTAIDGVPSDLSVLIIKVGGFILFYALLSLARNAVKYRYIERGTRQYKESVFQHILKQDVWFFKKNDTSEYTSILLNDINTISADYLNGTLLIIYNVIVFVLSISIMVYLNLTIALAVIGTSFFPLLISVLFGKKLAQSERELSDGNAKFTSFARESFMGFTLLKLFRSETAFSNMFSAENRRLELTRRSRNIRADNIGVLATALGYITLFSIYIISGYFVIKGSISIGSVLVFIQLGSYILGPISSLGALFPKRKAAYELILKNEQLIGQGDVEDERSATPASDTYLGAVALHHVSFSYDGDEEAVSDVSYAFEKGGCYALVGQSGCGKSTLLKLLMGLVPDYTGSIMLDDSDIKDLAHSMQFGLFSFIEQETFIFNASLRENITLFSDIDDTSLSSAIHQASLDNLVHAKGLDFICGENGSNLSGGERQRVAIARVLLKSAKVLLADECTAALDQKTSIDIENAILNMHGTTRIFVTHKLNEGTLRRCDAVLVMKKGKLLESDSFDNLMRSSTHFRQLYEADGGDDSVEI